MRFPLPRSWMTALDFSLGAAGDAGLASMHEPVGSDGGPSACQRILAAFGTILEPYDPHRRLVCLHILCEGAETCWLLLTASLPCYPNGLGSSSGRMYLGSSTPYAYERCRPRHFRPAWG